MSNSPLRIRDYLLVAGASAILFGYVVVAGRELTGHQSVLPQNAREMLADGDWLIPKIGGLPWLERPPLPQWITVAFASIIGRCDAEWIVRLPAACMAIVVVLLVTWMAGRWYGRNVGMLSGIILATMWEFFFYAANPEADIFLCAIVTGAIAVFIKIEFEPLPRIEPDTQRGWHALSDAKGVPGAHIDAHALRVLRACHPLRATGSTFLGRRCGAVLAFFILLGMTNLAKGLIFGMLMVCVPVASFLLINFDWTRIRQYMWLWGWLIFVVVAGAWPMFIYLRYPDIVELWSSDYLGRWSQGHVGEPRYYYLITLPWVTLPWTVPAFVGLWLTRRQSFTQRASPERFLWCWALVTPAFFSLPDGKHHHYLLQCLAPWAILGALGAVRLWKWIGELPVWVRNPAWAALLFGLPASLLVTTRSTRIPVSSLVIALAVVGIPIWLFTLTWATTWRNGHRAVVAIFSLWLLFYWTCCAFQANYVNSYEAESRFLKEVHTTAAATEPLCVHFDADLPLETFRLLFYSDPRAELLPNLTFLVDERLPQDEILVLGRLKDAAELKKYGTPVVLTKCSANRGLSAPDGNRALFRLTLHQDLPRRSADVYVSPMQVVHRKPGPFLR